METFLTAHPDTVLVIIDTLQMVRPARDATYANDYRDLSALKRIADTHGIAILLIHHLRKESADDVFNRIFRYYHRHQRCSRIPASRWWRNGGAAAERSSPVLVVTLNTES